MAAKSCPEQIPILIEIEVADVNDQIAAGFDQIKVERSTTGSGGPWAEISTATTTSPQARINLIQDRTEYTFEDPNGSQEYYYRFIIFNSSTSTDGLTSAGAPGAVDPALEICSIEELKTFYLFGVDLTNDRGEPYPDSLYAHYIKSAVDWLETKLMIQITPLDIEEERHDYYRGDYNKYIWIELNSFPVIEIEEVKLVLPGEQTTQVFEREWIHIQRDSGQLQLLPGTGTAGTILFGASGAWIPLIYGGNDFIPDVFRVKYKAGFGLPSPGATDTTPGAFPNAPVSNASPKLDRVPPKIKEVIGKLASIGPFNIAGDLLGGAGIASQSLSIDGLSQSFNTTSSATNAGYGARILQYAKELKDEIPQLERQYNGIRLRVA